MKNEKIIKRDENGKPIVGSYEYGTVDERQEALDKFKLAALSSFETELDALLNGMKNEDEIKAWFKLEVVNAVGSDSFERQTIRRYSDKEIALVNPKTMKDLKPVEEESKDE